MKEVVHVPTLELAEKVLKVAKEQGFKGPSNELEYYFKRKSNKLCFRFEEDGFSFAAKDIFKELGYKIITAEEFLNSYKPKFKPIAMKCSKEDTIAFAFIEASGDWKHTQKNNIHDETELEQLRKENHELKEKLKAIEDQPRVGDICLVWNNEPNYAAIRVYDSGAVRIYDNCAKATDKNIKKVMKQIKLNNK